MVKIDTELLEMFLYYWQATADREKVRDDYLAQLAGRPEMKVLYKEGFDEESVRKVLSAITNREILSEKTKEEGRFWNNNMWMLEDLGVTLEMLGPVKRLNPEQFEGLAEGNVTVFFIPGHLEPWYRKDGNLYVNFFKLMFDFATGEVEIDGRSVEEFVVSLLRGDG